MIGRDGKLYIRTIYQDEQEIPLELFGEYKWGDKCSISKVSYENGVESFKFGNDTGNNLWINQENMYIVDEEEVENIYNEIKDLEVYSFEGKTIIDPALDVGDKIIIDDKPVIYQGEMDFQTRFIAEISSKIAIKEKQETTVKTTSQKVINRRVQSRIDEAEGKITQLIEETSETSQKLTEVEQTVDGITQTVSSVETKVEQVEDKAEQAQSTADSATQKAETAQDTADNAQTSANNAQSTADGAVSQITITNQKVSQIEQTVSGITQSVSEVEEKVETVETKADNAQASANTANQNVEEIKKQTIYEVDVMYALSSSTTQAPTAGWSTTAPRWENGKYMWQKTVTTYGDGSKTESNATCIQGAKGQDGKDGTDGQDGVKGDTGIGVKSLVEQYYLSNSNTTQTGGGWKETQDIWTVGKYIWTRNKITWTDDTVTYTTPVLATGINNANSVANTANNTANTANTTANQAKETAEETNENLTTNYYTKIETNSQINQKADSITSEVSKTYSTKTETTNAKNEAIDSANASTDEKLQDYTVTEELGTVIEQNWEHVKIAWNQISDYIQMMIMNGTASLAILDQSGNVLMSLDKEGQNFYKSGENTPFGEMGVKKVDEQNYVSFSVLGEYGQTIQDGMAWGITVKEDNKFLPILYIKDFFVGDKNSETGSGKLVLSSCDIVLDSLGAGIEANNVKIHGDAMPGIYFTDTNSGRTIFSIIPQIINVQDASMYILDNISFYANAAGSNTFKIGNDKYCLFSDDGHVVCENINCNQDIYCWQYLTARKGIDCPEGYVSGIAFINNSKEQNKKNIEKFEKNAIEIIRNTDIYEFNYKTEKENAKKHVGFVIGDNYNYGKEITAKDTENEEIGADIYSMISVAYKAIQEQQEIIESLKNEIKELKEKTQ